MKTDAYQRQIEFERALSEATVEEAAAAILSNFHGHEAVKLIQTLIEGAVGSEHFGGCHDELGRFLVDHGIVYLGPFDGAIATHNCLKVDMAAWRKFRSTLDELVEDKNVVA